MEATINPKMPPKWLKIGLDYHRQGPEVTFGVTFFNVDQATQEFAFSNRARKAELLGLLIQDGSGQRVMPKHNLLIKPLNPDPDKHFFKGETTLSHELNGTLADNWLEFPGALFELRSGETYQVCFRYLGVMSNTVTLSV